MFQDMWQVRNTRLAGPLGFCGKMLGFCFGVSPRKETKQTNKQANKEQKKEKQKQRKKQTQHIDDV